MENLPFENFSRFAAPHKKARFQQFEISRIFPHNVCRFLYHLDPDKKVARHRQSHNTQKY